MRDATESTSFRSASGTNRARDALRRGQPCRGVGSTNFSTDERIARLAGSGHGVASRQELLTLGVTPDEIRHRLRTGRLRPLLPGVYAVGHEALSYRGKWRAAVAATLPDSALSFWSGAQLAGFSAPLSGPIHITAERPRRSLPGIVVHRGALPPAEVTTRWGIPVTAPARTLLDLAAVADERTLKRLVREAEYLRLITHESLAGILDRYPRRRGRAKLRRLVERATAGWDLTRSELEDRFLDFCSRRGLPSPETNVQLVVGERTFEVDCLWREAGLIAELDGHAAHATEGAFERDRRRDRVLLAAGFRSVRITWRQLHFEPDDLDRDLRQAIADYADRR